MLLSSKPSKNFKSFPPYLQKLGGRKCRKNSENESFLGILPEVAIWKSVTGAKIL